jgi:rhodanese-related sulfurtransferase
MTIGNRYKWLVALLVLALLLAGCVSNPVAPSKNADGYVKIEAAQLAGMLERKDLTLINVHIPYEGEIAGTDLLIPYDEIGSRTAELPGVNDKIVLYCRSGPMSTAAARALVALGYTQVYELDGGMNAWQAAGNPLVRR